MPAPSKQMQTNANKIRYGQKFVPKDFGPCVPGVDFREGMPLLSSESHVLPEKMRQPCAPARCALEQLARTTPW